MIVVEGLALRVLAGAARRVEVAVRQAVDDTVVPHPSWQECRVDNNIGTNNGKRVVPN